MRSASSITFYERHPLYPSWCGMRQSCGYIRGASQYHKKLYAGIRICEEWLEYSEFERWCLENGWKSGMKITRIDKTKDFCPGNCVIVPYETAVNMRRNTAIVDGVSVRTAFGRRTSGRHDRDYNRFVSRIRKCNWDVESARTCPRISRSNAAMCGNTKRKERK